MNLNRDQREEMKQLSKMFLGSEGKWLKILEKGVLEMEMKEVEETVPGETHEDGTVSPASTRMVKVPKLNDKGQTVKKIKYYTYEELRDKLLEVKKEWQTKQFADYAQRIAAGSASEQDSGLGV